MNNHPAGEDKHDDMLLLVITRCDDSQDSNDESVADLQNGNKCNHESAFKFFF